MRSRDSARVIQYASRLISQQLKASGSGGEAGFDPNLLRRTYAASGFRSQVFAGQGTTQLPEVSCFASTSLLKSYRSFQKSSKSALVSKRTATTNADSAQKLQETARSKMQSAMAVPGNAVSSAQQSVRNAGNAVYKQMPKPAQRWMTTVGKPGGFQRAVTLQIEGLWQANKGKIIALGALVGMVLLWRGLFGVTSMFVNLSESMAEFGFLALAAAIVAFTMLYFRRLYTIDPNAVYRKALIALNTNPGVLEVMGAPLAGSEVRAYVMTGGGVRFKGWLPRYRARRVQMIFPLKGTDKRGLVSLEAKKRQGKYGFKLLAVDVPTATGKEQRLFVDGNDQVYSRGGVMSELRDPFLRAISMQHTYEAEDEVDEASEDAATAQQQRIDAASQVSSLPEPHDGGMYFTERISYQARKVAARIQGSPAAPKAVKAKPSSNWETRS